MDPVSSQTQSIESKICILDFVQQPIRGLQCGYSGERPISPAPCIRLTIKDNTTNENLDISEIDASFYVLTAELWDTNCIREVGSIKSPSSGEVIARIVTGKTIVHASQFYDPDGIYGTWFVLDDLSVQIDGKYRLKVQLFDLSTQLGPHQSEIATCRTSVAVACCFSDVFEIFLKKRYPGPVPPTELSLYFAVQASKIGQKPDGGNRKMGKARKWRRDSEEDASEENVSDKERR